MLSASYISRAHLKPPSFTYSLRTPNIPTHLTPVLLTFYCTDKFHCDTLIRHRYSLPISFLPSFAPSPLVSVTLSFCITLNIYSYRSLAALRAAQLSACMRALPKIAVSSPMRL